MTAVEEHSWKFAQCFGDKSDSEDITEGTSICSNLKKKKLWGGVGHQTVALCI